MSEPVSEPTMADLAQHLDDLAAALHLWSTRDDLRPQPAVRRAANDAVSAIDGSLRALHSIRQRLVGEIRDADDAAARRVDALLAEGRRRD